MERQRFMRVYDPPAIIKKVLPAYKWNTLNGQMLLTFDDGPNPGTTQLILKELSDMKVKALFFCVGNNINRYGSLFPEILSEGHIAGNHTYNHRKLSFLEESSVSDELERTNLAAMDKFGYRLRYFRPPFGKFDLKTAGIAKRKGLTPVLWSLLTYDFRNDFQIVKQSIDKSLRKNSIIVFHDSNKSASILIDSLKYLRDYSAAQGLRFGVPDECLSK